jgi:Flp pilus assembly protein TadG
MVKRIMGVTRNTDRKGAMLVLVAITMILLVIAAAFSIDVAYMQLTRTELRTSTDAAARAATEADRKSTRLNSSH